MKKYILILAALLVVFGSIWGFWHQGESEKDTIKIVAVYPMTGNLGKFGEAAKISSKMFFDKFLQKDRKFKYELRFEDDQFSPAKSVSIVQRLVSLNQADIIITLMSSNAIAIAPLVQKAKIPHFTSAIMPEIAAVGNYNFIISSSADLVAEKMINELKKRQLKNIYIIGLNVANMQTYQQALEKNLEKHKDINVIEKKVINPGEKNFQIILKEVERKKPDIILTLMLSPEIEIFMRKYRQAKLSAPVTGIVSFGHLKDKSLAEGMWYIDPESPSKAFEDEYKSVTGNSSSDYGEFIYTDLQIITKIMESMDSQTYSKEEFIQKVLPVVNNIDSVIGKLRMSSDRIGVAHPVTKIISGETVTTITNEE